MDSNSDAIFVFPVVDLQNRILISSQNSDLQYYEVESLEAGQKKAGGLRDLKFGIWTQSKPLQRWLGWALIFKKTAAALMSINTISSETTFEFMLWQDELFYRAEIKAVKCFNEYNSLRLKIKFTPFLTMILHS